MVACNTLFTRSTQYQYLNVDSIDLLAFSLEQKCGELIKHPFRLRVNCKQAISSEAYELESMVE